MNILKHVTHQPFIAATGAAALVHSTWALAVLFAGEPPQWNPHDILSWAGMAYWLLPALLIAFALDVGQIATSSEIRSGERTRAKYATFAVFAVATYYLQWLYIAHHMPALELGPGVYRDGLAGRLVLMTRNAAIWIIPALLPVSTLLYTISGGEPQNPPTAPTAAPMPVPVPTPVQVEQPHREALPPPMPHDETAEPEWWNDLLDGELAQLAEPEQTPKGHVATCHACGWSKSYASEGAAARGLAAHQSRHCSVLGRGALHSTISSANGAGGDHA